MNSILFKCPFTNSQKKKTDTFTFDFKFPLKSGGCYGNYWIQGSLVTGVQGGGPQNRKK